MSTPDLPCRLLCASESAYAISTDASSGQYNPLYMTDPNGKRVLDPTKKIYEKQYNAVGFKGKPFVVTSIEIEAALVGKTDTEVIIAFRGTLPPVPFTIDGFFDWMQDLWAAPTTNINQPGKIHHGFLFAMLSIADGIRDAVNELDPTNSLPIYVTGHSKGGGMAPIGALYFRNAFKMEIEQTITFAGPKPGDTEFCTTYNTIFPNDLRYENYLYMVPLLPPSDDFIEALEDFPLLPSFVKNMLKDAATWNYDTVGTLRYINSEGNVAIIPTLMAIRIADIMEALVTNPMQVADAHHASCGYRYMKGTCKGTVCNG